MENLFEFLFRAHGLTILEDDANQIRHIVNKEQGLDDLLKKLVAMRKAQQQFFKLRTNQDLAAAKKAEAEVDYWIRNNYPELLKANPLPSLFS